MTMNDNEGCTLTKINDELGKKARAAFIFVQPKTHLRFFFVLNTHFFTFFTFFFFKKPSSEGRHALMVRTCFPGDDCIKSKDERRIFSFRYRSFPGWPNLPALPLI